MPAKTAAMIVKSDSASSFLIAKVMAFMIEKSAIMPSKSAATYDSKSANLNFLSTENGESQLNFCSHYMLH